MFNGYAKTRWYWEFVVMARKICLVGISVFLTEYLQVQALMSVFLCTVGKQPHTRNNPPSLSFLLYSYLTARGADVWLCVFAALALQLAYNPFEAFVMNVIETGSLISSFLTFYCSMFLFLDNVPEYGQVAASMVVVCVNMT